MATKNDNFSIKIPKDMWRVVKPSRTDVNEGYPLAFLTPDGTDKAAAKRKETGIHWAMEYGEDISAPASRTFSFTNLPRDGFRIAKAVKRSGWNGGNVVWRIEDPYGFTVEIQSGNLQNIIEDGTIVAGLIMGKCVWARDGASNILLPVYSEEYKQATRNTENLKVSFSHDSVEPGSTVKMRDGREMIWLGKYFVHEMKIGETVLDPKNDYADTYLDPFVKCSDKAKFCFYDPNHEFEWRAKSKEIYAYSKFDIIEVIEKDSLMTVSEKIINKMLTKCRVRTGTDYLYHAVALTKEKRNLEWNFVLESMPKEKWPLSDITARDISRKIIAKHLGMTLEFVSYTHRWSRHTAPSVNFFVLDELTDKKYTLKREEIPRGPFRTREPHTRKVPYNVSVIPDRDFHGEFFYLNVFFPELNSTATLPI